MTYTLEYRRIKLAAETLPLLADLADALASERSTSASTADVLRAIATD